jgi:hypothetical protein
VSRIAPATVELSIEHLVLDGFAAQQSERMRQVIERELGRLVNAYDLTQGATQCRQRTLVDAGSINVNPSAGPEKIASAIARAVVEALKS